MHGVHSQTFSEEEEVNEELSTVRGSKKRRGVSKSSVKSEDCLGTTDEAQLSSHHWPVELPKSPGMAVVFCVCYIISLTVAITVLGV